MSMRVRSESGGALVELAISIPVLVYLLVGAIDFARVFYMGIALSDSARAGAQYGSHSLSNSGNIAGMQTIATGATNVTGIAASASRTCYCAALDGSAFSTVACGGAVESIVCPGQRLVVNVTVATSKTFNLLAPYPGIPDGLALSHTATLRVVN